MSSEPEYQRTDDTFADFRRRYGSPSVVENYYPTVVYGWWAGSDYVSLRVNGTDHETYVWIDCPLPMDQ